MQKKGRGKSRIEEVQCNSKRWTSSFVGNFRQPITHRFGTALREQRKSLGITQADLSTATGLSRSYISEVECGHENISLERAERLAQAVSSTLSDLLRDG